MDKNDFTLYKEDNTIKSVAVPPGPVGVTFLKDVDIKFFLLAHHI